LRALPAPAARSPGIGVVFRAPAADRPAWAAPSP